MNEEQRIKMLEEELKILKNEVKTILLDIREQYLNVQNPFNFNMVPNAGTPPNAGPDAKAIDPGLDNFNIPEALPMPEMEMPEMFGKPFDDPSGPQIEAAGGAPIGMGDIIFNDIPGMGTMPGAGPSMGDTPGVGFSMDAGSDDESEIEEVPQPKKSRGKKKKNASPQVEMEVEDDLGEDSDFDDKEEDRSSRKNNKKKKDAVFGMPIGGKADLYVIAGLTQWVDQASSKLGKERAETLVEMAYAMGRIPDNIKDVLIRMTRISRYEADGQTPTATDYLAILAQLESLMGGSEVQDKALLSILSMMKESVRG